MAKHRLSFGKRVHEIHLALHQVPVYVDTILVGNLEQTTPMQGEIDYGWYEFVLVHGFGDGKGIAAAETFGQFDHKNTLMTPNLNLAKRAFREMVTQETMAEFLLRYKDNPQ